MTKEEVCKVLNDMILEVSRKCYDLLVDNNIHVGDIKKLSVAKAPNDYPVALPHNYLFMLWRFDALAKMFVDRFKHRLDSYYDPCKINMLHTGEEVQAEYDKQKKLENEVQLINEYISFI